MQRTVLHSDDRSDDRKPVSPRRIELYSGDFGRRRWADELKARIVMESLVPDAVVTQVAQRHGCRAQQIHEWRRLARTGRLALPVPAAFGGEAPVFVPVIAEAAVPAAMAPAASGNADLEVEIAGATVRAAGRAWRRLRTCSPLCGGAADVDAAGRPESVRGDEAGRFP
jgi:transposase